MFKSSEIRWFSKTESEPISSWFAQQGLTFDTVKSRTDYYLVALNKEMIAPKLREGKIEIKHRISEPRKMEIAPFSVGYFEEWMKWSFELKEGDGESSGIIKDKKYAGEWVAVYKERMGVKLVKKENGSIGIHKLEERFDSGCQMEYTRVYVKGQVWFTFNLEWFGEEFLELDDFSFKPLLYNSPLKLEDSMGYGQFLLTLSA